MWQPISRQLISEMLPAQPLESIPNSQCAKEDEVFSEFLKRVSGTS